MFSILFNSVLATKKFYCFFLFFFSLLLVFFFVILLLIEDTKPKFALAIPTGSPKKVVNEVIETLPIAACKTSKIFY